MHMWSTTLKILRSCLSKNPPPRLSVPMDLHKALQFKCPIKENSSLVGKRNEEII